jgi:hypothetical protein
MSIGRQLAPVKPDGTVDSVVPDIMLIEYGRQTANKILHKRVV